MRSASDRRLMSCEGKKRFQSFGRAERVAGDQARRYGGKFSAYSCRDCAGFHVGSHRGHSDKRAVK